MFLRILPLFLIVFVGLFCLTVKAKDETTIIPNPREVNMGEGLFTITSQTKVVLSQDSKELREVVDSFITTLKKSSQISLKTGIAKTAQNGSIFLDLKKTPELGEEGYNLSVKTDGIHISATEATGIFYGLQTIRQLLPAQIEGTIEAKDLQVPCLEIKDQPRYGWRGVMLDESRHFFGKDQVKKILDAMALYKMNRFHWHLTDTDGWRIEIKKYPKLTTVGGIGDRTDKKAAAQFYTQEEIKEIVEYARLRHIQVIPEIDMPGHAAAANRAYPEYSGGGSKRHPEFTFNPAKEETYKFCQDILREVVTLFPSKWIHIGGDEVHFGWEQWPKLPEVQALMKEKGFKGLKDVENYFIRRMAKFINDDLGKTITGWDELTGSGVKNDNSLLMWWRHDKPHLRDQALKNGYKTVLCPRQPCYFDFVQIMKHRKGRKWGGAATLEKIIDFPKFPKNYTEKELNLVQGIQCNLWSETVKTDKRLDFMIFPRMLAIAESAWTVDKRKSQKGFKTRLKANFPRLDAMKIYYYNLFDPKSTPEPQK